MFDNIYSRKSVNANIYPIEQFSSVISGKCVGFSDGCSIFYDEKKSVLTYIPENGDTFYSLSF